MDKFDTEASFSQESFGHVDKSTCGFKKPLSKEGSQQFFGSLDSVYSKSLSGTDHHSMTPSISLEVIRRAFSTEAVELTRDNDTQASGQKQLAKTLNSEELMKLDFYSKFTPTSVTLSHFLDHSSGGGTVEDSFLFLRREIPVRLANMMMELEVSSRSFNSGYL